MRDRRFAFVEALVEKCAKGGESFVGLTVDMNATLGRGEGGCHRSLDQRTANGCASRSENARGERRKLVTRKDAEAERIVEITACVGVEIGRAHDQRFGAATLETERLAGEHCPGLSLRVGQHTFEHGARTNDAAAVVGSLELGEEPHAERRVMKPAHARFGAESGEYAFSGVSERRMTDVVRERNHLDEVVIEQLASRIEPTRERERNLRDLERVCEACAEVIVVGIGDDLRLVRQTAKGTRSNEAAAVFADAVFLALVRDTYTGHTFSMHEPERSVNSW